MLVFWILCVALSRRASEYDLHLMSEDHVQCYSFERSRTYHLQSLRAKNSDGALATNDGTAGFFGTI
jgi:hypothetical protein